MPFKIVLVKRSKSILQFSLKNKVNVLFFSMFCFQVKGFWFLSTLSDKHVIK